MRLNASDATFDTTTGGAADRLAAVLEHDPNVFNTDALRSARFTSVVDASQVLGSGWLIVTTRAPSLPLNNPSLRSQILERSQVLAVRVQPIRAMARSVPLLYNVLQNADGLNVSMLVSALDAAAGYPWSGEFSFAPGLRSKSVEPVFDQAVLNFELEQLLSEKANFAESRDREMYQSPIAFLRTWQLFPTADNHTVAVRLRSERNTAVRTRDFTVQASNARAETPGSGSDQGGEPGAAPGEFDNVDWSLLAIFVLLFCCSFLAAVSALACDKFREEPSLTQRSKEDPSYLMDSGPGVLEVGGADSDIYD